MEKVDIELCPVCNGLTTDILNEFAKKEVDFHKLLGSIVRTKLEHLSKFVDEKMGALEARAAKVGIE